MEWLNYHHLLYFWAVAKHGGVARAGKALKLTSATVSSQVHKLEEMLGEQLFERKGRALVLTESGRVAYRYADEIFALGREFLEATRGRPVGRQLSVVVGVAEAFPKSIVHRILTPLFQREKSVRVTCRADRSAEAFIGDLAVQAVDVVLADAPAGTSSPVRVFSHLLGECGTAFVCASKRAASLRRRFPQSLSEAAFLLPEPGSALRRTLDPWFEAQRVRPQIMCETNDLALASVLGEQGLGVFAVPDVIVDEVRRRHGVRLIGRARSLRQRFYAITMERRIRHPAVVALHEVARQAIFA
jgi:LysR family transcriptional regulator, transcriptional activator of nhaA